MLVERDGDPDFVKVLDFGIAKVPIGELIARRRGRRPAATGRAHAARAWSTARPSTWRPSRRSGKRSTRAPISTRSACILYEMLTGVRPFDAESKVALLGHAGDLRSLRPWRRRAPRCTCPTVEALVRRLLEKEAARRYQDAREVLDGIDGCRMATAKTEHNMPAMPTPLGMPASARYRASLASVPRTAIDIPSGSLALKRAQVMEWLTEVRDRLARSPRSILAAGFAGCGRARRIDLVHVEHRGTAGPVVSFQPLREQLHLHHQSSTAREADSASHCPRRHLSAAVAAGPTQLAISWRASPEIRRRGAP